MDRRPMAELLRAWRDAETAWTRTPADDPEELRRAALAVVHAWLDYQAASNVHGDALVLVADGSGRYVAVGGPSEPLLGHPPHALVGSDLRAITAPDSVELGAELWESFLVTGRQDGVYELLHAEGHAVPLAYLARAHFPVAGFHTSILTPIER